MHVLTTRVRGLPEFGAAVAGLLLGHAVSYALAIPDPHHRDLVLDRTGHAYLPAAGQVALILVVAGLVALLVRASAPRGRARDRGVGSLAATLVLVQVGAFTGQEVLERLLSGAPLGDLLHDHLLAIGLAVQVLVALAGAAVLHALARAATRVVLAAGRRTGPPRPALAGIVPAPASRPRGRAILDGRSVRAPPAA
jgi:nitrate reductase gamma subunit